MRHNPLDSYEALASNNCSENKCRVRLDGSLVSYCGEKLRDRVRGPNYASPSPICDCFITGPSDHISLVELKHYRGRNKCISVSKVRKQLSGGFALLRDILHDQQKTEAAVQLVLCTNGKFQYTSQRLEFQKSILPDVNMQINDIPCGSKLPEKHKKIKIDHMPDT